MNRRSLAFALLPTVLLRGTLTQKAEAGIITGIGLTLDEWLKKFGEPDSYLEVGNLNIRASVYECGEFTVAHNLREGYAQGILFHIVYHPEKSLSLYHLREGCEQFLPTDSRQLNLTAAAGAMETEITYTSQVLKETLASSTLFVQHGEIVVQFFRDGESSTLYRNAVLRLPTLALEP